MLKGNDQKVYLNGEVLATLSKAEAKLKIDFEDVELCGQYSTEHEYVGYSIEGTITFKKVDSKVLSLYHKAVTSGRIPDLVITGVNMTVDGKTESVTISDAKVTELALINAEAKKVIEEEVPFNASKFKVNNLIA